MLYILLQKIRDNKNLSLAQKLAHVGRVKKYYEDWAIITHENMVECACTEQKAHFSIAL